MKKYEFTYVKYNPGYHEWLAQLMGLSAQGYEVKGTFEYEGGCTRVIMLQRELPTEDDRALTGNSLGAQKV